MSALHQIQLPDTDAPSSRFIPYPEPSSDVAEWDFIESPDAFQAQVRRFFLEESETTITWTPPIRLSQRGAYADRFGELEEMAREEGICPVNPEAKGNFFEFLDMLTFSARQASLALLDDGSLGATWRNERWRLGLKFVGDAHVEFVLLDRENPPEGTTGKCRLQGLHIEYGDLDIRKLLEE